MFNHFFPIFTQRVMQIINCIIKPKNMMISKSISPRSRLCATIKVLVKKRACSSSRVATTGLGSVYDLMEEAKHITTSLKFKLPKFTSSYYSKVPRGLSPLSTELHPNPELSFNIMKLGLWLLTSKSYVFGTSWFS